MNGTLAARLWITTWGVLSIGFIGFAIFTNLDGFGYSLLACAIAFIASLPSLLLLLLIFYYGEKIEMNIHQKLYFIVACNFLICLGYGLLAWIIAGANQFSFAGIATLVLFGCTLISFAIHYKWILNNLHDNQYQLPETGNLIPAESNLSDSYHTIENQSLTTNKNKQMENEQFPTRDSQLPEPENKSNNKVFIKAGITAALILLMMIPTLFITNLVKEREQRQKEVVEEVSNKWAKPQTISTPYIVVPYTYTYTTADKKTETAKKNIILLPENLQVNGTMNAQERKRSIYTVLLYQSEMQASGSFAIKIPSDKISENILWKEARLCVGVTDFKGINNQVTIKLNGVSYELTPGLPTRAIDEDGLSTAISITAEEITKPMDFTFALNINGSKQLSFVPLAGNSQFSLQSKWPDPSFDGATLPFKHNISDSGFTAQWSFNKARLPYGTFLEDFKIDKSAFAFGVSMVEPGDQYAKTMRSVKYAILFIGLTFSLFFIIELMQKRPVHPVQYVLVGLALVIFYTLLLSISEFVLFDVAYLIAASATVLLITLYAKSHFKIWKVASVFAGVLGMLYSFIFVLISLEDTSLLVGSIGLFAVLALVMYASRKINWYDPSFGKNTVVG